MGVCYKIILLDEFDWKYAGTTKLDRLAAFTKEYQEAGAYCCEYVSQGYGTAVFDVDKCSPYNEKYREVIKKFSDSAYFIADIELTKVRSIDEIA